MVEVEPLPLLGFGEFSLGNAKLVNSGSIWTLFNHFLKQLKKYE